MAWFKRDPSSVRNRPVDDAARTVKTEGLWLKCDGCREIIWKKDLAQPFNPCAKCGHHFRMDARARLALLFDGGLYEELDADLASADPLGFVDSKSYASRLKQMQLAT